MMISCALRAAARYRIGDRPRHSQQFLFDDFNRTKLVISIHVGNGQESSFLRTDLLALPPERQKDNEMQGAWMCLLGEEKSMIL